MKHTIYHFQFRIENHHKFSKICSQRDKNVFETTVVNEPSVFEPLKFDCILLSLLLSSHSFPHEVPNTC